MEKNYTYEVVENGYYIKLNGKRYMTQLEPHIPDKTKTYEENALAQIEELKQADVEASKPHISEEDRISALEDAMNIVLGF